MPRLTILAVTLALPTNDGLTTSVRTQIEFRAQVLRYSVARLTSFELENVQERQ